MTRFMATGPIGLLTVGAEGQVAFANAPTTGASSSAPPITTNSPDWPTAERLSADDALRSARGDGKGTWVRATPRR